MLYSKFSPKINTFRNFSKFSPIMLFQCFHYVPKFATLLKLSWNILISECSIRVFQYKVTVVLESINLRTMHLSALL